MWQPWTAMPCQSEPSGNAFKKVFHSLVPWFDETGRIINWPPLAEDSKANTS
jgi:hypothetical protein